MVGSSTYLFGCSQGDAVMIHTAISVLPPLAMTMLSAMKWRGPPMRDEFTDV